MIKQISLTRIAKNERGHEWEMVIIYDNGSEKTTIKSLDDFEKTLKEGMRIREFLDSQSNV